MREREPRRTGTARRARMVACTTGGLRPLTPLGTPPGVPQRPCLPLALPSHSLTPRSGAARGCSQLLLLWYSTTTMRVYHACTMHMPGSLRRAPASRASTRARNVANVCQQRLTRAHQWANCPANCRIPAGAPHVFFSFVSFVYICRFTLLCLTLGPRFNSPSHFRKWRRSTRARPSQRARHDSGVRSKGHRRRSLRTG